MAEVVYFQNGAKYSGFCFKKNRAEMGPRWLKTFDSSRDVLES